MLSTELNPEYPRQGQDKGKRYSQVPTETNCRDVCVQNNPISQLLVLRLYKEDSGKIE